jgi:spoIIIJ-associated protein
MSTDEATATDGGRTRLKQLELEGDIAADYLDTLLAIADFEFDMVVDVEGDRAMISIAGAELTELVGPGGRVLDALQELSRLAVTRETGERSRLMLDVAGFRAARRAELVTLGEDAVAEVERTGAPVKLAAMTAFERKVVHDVVAAHGLVSSSEGAEPDRRIVVAPA